MKTTAILSFLLGIIPEFIICYLIMNLLNEGWVVFWFAYIGIQIIGLLRWVYLKLAGSIFFRLKMKQEIKNGIYSDLVKNNFPNPDNYTFSTADHYFDAILNDSDEECNMRLAAKEISTTLIAIMTLQGIQAYVQWEKSAHLALTEYSDKF